MRKFQRFFLGFLFVLLGIATQVQAAGLPFNAKMRGRLLMDAGAFFNAPDTLSARADIVDLRLGAMVKVGEEWSLKADIGFARNKVALKDVYLQFLRGAHCVRAGHMHTFGIEQPVGSSDLVFNSAASVAETFYTKRRLGLTYTLADAHYYAMAGVFMGDKITVSDNEEMGFNSSIRGVWRPVNEDQHLFQVGVSGFYRLPDAQKATDMRPRKLTGKGPTRLNSPYLLSVAFPDVLHEWMAGVECYTFNEKWLLQSEYMVLFLNRPDAKHYTAQGGYVQAGYLIKGSHYGYSSLEALPLLPKDERALMLVARYNVTNLNDGSANVWGGCQHDISLGLNYYINRYISTRLNYSYVSLDKNSVLGANDLHLIQARLQIRF